MTKEELIKRYESLKSYFPREVLNATDVHNLQIGKLIIQLTDQIFDAVIKDLKQLNGEVRQAPHGESSLHGDP